MACPQSDGGRRCARRALDRARVLCRRARSARPGQARESDAASTARMVVGRGRCAHGVELHPAAIAAIRRARRGPGRHLRNRRARRSGGVAGFRRRSRSLDGRRGWRIDRGRARPRMEGHLRGERRRAIAFADRERRRRWLRKRSSVLARFRCAGTPAASDRARQHRAAGATASQPRRLPRAPGAAERRVDPRSWLPAAPAVARVDRG